MAVPHRAQPVHAGQRGLRGFPERGRADHRAARPRPRRGIYYPAISAIIQRLFTGKDRSRAFGYLGGVVGVSTAAGPLLGGVLVQLAGVTDGWRWVFLVNLFIGMAALPVAFRLLPSRHDAEEHRLDFAGNLLLAAVLLLILVPLVEGRVSGWPAWSWLLLGLAVPAAATRTPTRTSARPMAPCTPCTGRGYGGCRA